MSRLNTDFLKSLSAVLFVFAVGHVQAASPGLDTLQQLRQQMREEVQKKELEKIPDVKLEPDSLVPEDIGKLPVNESPCFVINTILLEGELSDQFQWALEAANPAHDPATGKCLGTEGINRVMRRVQNAVIAKGFVTTRILAQPQMLNTCRLTLTLIPGRVRDIKFSTQDNGYVANALPMGAGELLNLRDLEQGLENFKRLPTVEADIQIAPSQDEHAKPGESDLIINWQQDFPLRTTLALDDAGSDATGKYQGNISLAYDHILRLNDILVVSYLHDLGGGDDGARGNDGYNVHYSLPFGYWMLAVSGGDNEYYQTVAGATQNYVYSGTSHTADLKISRLFYRDQKRKSTASLKGWMRTSKNYIDDTEVEVQRRRMAGWEAGLNHREFIRAATLDVNLNYRRGTGAFDSLPAPEENFDEGTSRPKIILADMQYNLPFTWNDSRLRYFAQARAQWNRTPLVPQDRFTIGGRYSVRGFDGENVLSAERGWLLRNDLGYAFGQGHEVYIGMDYGVVSGPASDTLLGTRLAGEVLGLRGAYQNLNYDVFIGQPLHKPAGFQTSNHAAGFSLIWSF